jgi:hypothetical protein
MKKNLLLYYYYALSYGSILLFIASAVHASLEEELSRTDLSIPWWGDDLPESFQFEWRIERTHLLSVWPNITNHMMMTSAEVEDDETIITFTRRNNNYGRPDDAFDSIVALITDGVELETSHWLCASGMGSCAGGSSTIKLKSDMFQNQTGCYNDIDLEGNRIESISLEVDYYDAEYYKMEPNSITNTATVVPTFHFTIAAYGHKLLPNEDALALIDLGSYGGMCRENTAATLEFSVFEDALHWAVVEFPIVWGQVQVGDKIQALREFGTRSMTELLTNGDDGWCSQCIDWSSEQQGPKGCGGPIPRNESTFFKELETCFNDVDLQGNYLQSVSTYIESLEFQTGNNRACTIHAIFVVDGDPGMEPDPPEVCNCPDCNYNGSHATTRAPHDVRKLLFQLVVALFVWMNTQ